jgi:hypothetical protein
LGVDESLVYWTHAALSIRKAPKLGGAPVVMIVDQLAPW